MTAVTGCPCGAPHELTPGIVSAYESITAGLPADLLVTTPGGSWHVPRVYIACHGIKAADVPALAGRYGWERAVAEPPAP